MNSGPILSRKPKPKRKKKTKAIIKPMSFFAKNVAKACRNDRLASAHALRGVAGLLARRQELHMADGQGADQPRDNEHHDHPARPRSPVVCAAATSGPSSGRQT